MKYFLIIPFLLSTLLSSGQSRRIGAGAAPSGSGAGSWGAIIGTLSNQTDLQTALNAKAALVHPHATSDITSGQLGVARIGSGTPTSLTYLNGAGAWTTFPIPINNTSTSSTGSFLDASQGKVLKDLADTKEALANKGAASGYAPLTSATRVDTTYLPRNVLNENYFGGNGSTIAFYWKIPEYTTTQRDALATPPTSRLIYNTTTNHPNYWNGTTWISL